MELARRIERQHAQRILFRYAPVLHWLVELVDHERLHQRDVRVQAGQHAVLVHDRRVVGDRVVGLQLVGPPVAEGRGRRAVGRHLVGDLVALQHVGERVDLEAEALRHAHEHDDLVAAVGVRVHPNSPGHDVH